MSSTHSHGGHSHAGHHHGHAHGAGLTGENSQAPKALMRALGMTFFFMSIELVGGLYANSLALISDAAHNLTDIGALLLSLFAIWIARRPVTQNMSFGYHRAEILGALVSGLSIWVISGFLIYEAVLRISSPPEVKGPIVFFIAMIGLLANLVSMWMLYAEKDKNLNVRGAYLHLVSDSLGNLGAVIAGAVLWATGWHAIDPLITILFSVLMLASSWGLIKEAIGILMESTPSHLNSGEIQQSLLALPGIKEVHDLHVWSVSNNRPALSVHLVGENSEGLLMAANALLQDKYQIIHTTIQVEHPTRFQSERCYDCVPLEKRETK